MSHPMIPAEPEGNQTKHTKQKRYSPGKEKGSLTLDENDRVYNLFRDEPKSHPHHGTERPWGSGFLPFELSPGTPDGCCRLEPRCLLAIEAAEAFS